MDLDFDDMWLVLGLNRIRGHTRHTNTYHQKPNQSRETVPLSDIFTDSKFKSGIWYMNRGLKIGRVVIQDR
jgi:hypothetical protein